MLAVVGGTGLYKIPNLEILEERLVEGPFGAPSGPVLRGKIASKEILFLARHGGGHSFLPHEINYRANIYALKTMGAKALLSVSAVGSLREIYKPGDLVAIDQYIDLTKGLRKHTYFGDGIAAHLTSAHPVSQKLKEALSLAATQVKLTNRTIHSSEKSAVIYACVEGPRLGTRAESLMLRNMGADLVGMTNVPEVFLAREAQIAYLSLAIVTDYDSWMEDNSKHVEISKIFELYNESLQDVLSLIQQVVKNYSSEEIESCPSRKTLTGSVITPDSKLNSNQKKLLELLRL